MRAVIASFGLAGLLLASVAGKIAMLTSTAAQERAKGADVAVWLKSHGFEVQPVIVDSTPVWIVGLKGNCRIRLVDVAPEGWSQSIIDQQTSHDQLSYVFDGRFYAQQPVVRTRLANYKRRLARYAGIERPQLRVLAMAVSAECPPDMIGPQDAIYLSADGRALQ